MLAVFPKTVGSLPEALKKPHPDDAVSAMTTEFLNTHFTSAYPNSVSIKHGSTGFLAYSLQRKITLLARSFSCKEGIFCIFQGHLDNNMNLKEKYGLTIAADEASITVEAYRALRDRVNNTRCPELVIKEFEGLFGFVVIDIIRNTIFIGSDCERNNSFFWGTDVEENLVFSDDPEIVKQACHTSQGPFPKNCLFTTQIGLRNLEHPMYEMKAVDIEDNETGKVCGTKFEVDTGNEREAKYRRRACNSRDWTGEI